jgi:hypothetical protein
MANLSAAETLKAELASHIPVKSHTQAPKPIVAAPVDFSVGRATAAKVDRKVPGLGASDPEAGVINAQPDDPSVYEAEMSSKLRLQRV